MNKIGCLIIVFVVLITACVSCGEKEPHQLSAPLEFDSLEAFEQFEKDRSVTLSNDAPVPSYFVPDAVPQGYVFAKVSKRENVYIMPEYKTSAAPEQSGDLSDYALERLQCVLYKYCLYADADAAAALQSNYADKAMPRGR